MSITPAVQVVPVEQLGPRATAFMDKTTAAKNAILQQVFFILNRDQRLPAREFIEKNVTALGQQNIASLDARTQILFKNVVFEATQNLFEIKLVHQVFLLLSNKVEDPKAHGKFIKEVALPIILALVADLDENYPGVVDEAVSGGIISPENHTALGLD